MKSKIKFIAKMSKFQKNIRENNEEIIKLKGKCPDNKIPKGLLDLDSSQLKDSFKHAKSADLINEMRPNEKP